MPIRFSTPAGSPTKNFSGQVAAFPGNDGETGASIKSFSTPAGSPTRSFSGQIVAF